MKKLIISLLTALAIILPAPLAAQTLPGAWEVFPSYGTPTRLVDTPEYVYLLTNKSLIAHDKATGELMALNTNNRLNSNTVSGIWYSKEGKFLFVAYADANVDLLYDDGRTVNIADLANAPMDVGTINDVDFRDGRAYLALTKGIVVINTDKGIVEQSGIFGENFARIAVTDSKVILAYAQNARLFTADRTAPMTSFRPFNANNMYVYKSGSTIGDIIGLDGDKFLAIGNATMTSTNPAQNMMVVTVDPTKENNACLTDKKKVGVAATNRLTPTKNGYLGATQTILYYVDNDGNLVNQVNHNISGMLSASTALANWDDTKTTQVWQADANGLGLRDIPSATYPIAQTRPASTSGTNVGQFAPASNGTLYLATYRRSIGSSLQGDGSAAKFDIIDSNGKTTPINLSVTTKYDMIVNPLNKDEIVVTHRTGLVRHNLKTGEKTTYNATNSPMLVEWTTNQSVLLVYSATFDSEGNLWVLQDNDIDKNNPNVLHMIPAADWNNGASAETWKTIRIGKGELWHSSIIRFVPTGSGYILIGGKTQLICIDLNNTYSNLTDDIIKIYDWNTDTDGMSIEGYSVNSITTDQNGWTWIGYDAGVMYYTDLAKIFTSSPEPTRPKVARNDGTSLADFLLTNVDVYDLTVDANNNKWIATNGSGLYRVNSDGTEILDHFTTENSDIPSDNVLAVYPDPESNKVYVGTDKGLTILHSSTSPAAQDYSDVYAYPNPVTPEYTGYITICGLMNNSLVKITDQAGRVVHETRSDGGSAVWDGCDVNGSRVKSGVYFVYASQNASGSSSATVTKIVVVN